MTLKELRRQVLVRLGKDGTLEVLESAMCRCDLCEFKGACSKIEHKV